MLDRTIEDAVKTFTATLKESEVYLEYVRQLQIIKEHQELYKKVNEFRMKNYELQTQEPAGDLLEMVDSFEQEYEEIIENPIVSEFLRAELTFCRMMQEVNIYIAGELDFE